MADSPSLTYHRQPGSARRYRIFQTGETISYRQYLKRTKGIIPERRAAERKAHGVVTLRQTRKDKGLPRGSVARLPAHQKHKPDSRARAWSSSRARRLVVPLDIPVTIQANVAPARSRVLHAHMILGEYLNVGHGARKWQCCICPLRLREESSIIHHIYYHHGPGKVAVPLDVNGGGQRVMYTGDVRSSSRTSRMPWRVASDDPRYK
ncbi:MAG: hypothetical protein H0X24_04795 [Ktedonobacterales bacterium]|nr:hypothetical protein [Ktedonobacterales bacterium]